MIVTSGPGYRLDPINKSGMHTHKGIDLRLERGSTLRAWDELVVTAIGEDDRFGNWIRLLDGLRVWFLAHLESVQVQQGDLLKPGTEFGRSGATGLTTGAHLHIAVTNVRGLL